MAKSKRRKISQDRYDDAYNDRDKGGISRPDIIDWGALKSDHEDMAFFEIQEGTNKINIIPFEIAGELNPRVVLGKAEKGELDYVLDVWVHQRLGEAEGDYICPKKTYGKRCPICELEADLKRRGKDEEAKGMRAKRRVLYNVQVIKRGEPEKELRVFTASHFLVEKELIEEAAASGENGGVLPFADIDDGAIIKFRGEEDKFGGRKYIKPKAFRFMDREEELDDDLIDEAVDFSKYLILKTPDELEAILSGQDMKDEEEEEDEAPKKSKRQSRDEDEDDDEEEKPRRRKSKVHDDDDDEYEEEPPRKSRRSKSDEDEDEEEEEPPKKRRKKSETECPAGMKFGKDFDTDKACDSCDLWDDCAAAHDKAKD